MNQQKILFFDGDCLLCNHSVAFLHKSLPADSEVFYSSLSGETAKKLLSPEMIHNKNSVVFYNGENVFTKSKAVQTILRNSTGFTKILFYLLKFIPRPIADFGYDIIAKYRTIIFKKGYCEFNPDLQKKILP